LQSNINEAMANSNNLGIETMTHALISESGPNTEIVGNLFLGATFTAIQIAQGQTGLRIEQNVFDGWNVGRHALDFDFTTTNETRVTFKNNIVAGYRLPPIHRQSSARSGSNEQKTSFTGLSAGDNTFVALTGPAYEGFGEHSSFGTGDRHVESLSAIGLTRAMPNSPATQAAADVDELLLTHRRSIAEVRQAWFEIYKSGPSK
ncbi:MAG: hypothetical protein FWC56_01355, partial [Phycisphaerae bacterium]|nr:hypothetical protein [Phycisphaerae bacterium]